MTRTPFAPTIIDLSRLAAPAAIEKVLHSERMAAFVRDFLAEWEIERQADPSLPTYDVEMLPNDTMIVFARAWGNVSLFDRQRVNDGIKALLAPLATGTDLDNVVARQNVQRRLVKEATSSEPALMETDAALLRRYLLSFDRPSAGSAARYLYEAWTAWPAGVDAQGRPVGMGDARVNGRIVHGRAGDTDVVISGPGGRDPTMEEMAVIRAAILDPAVRPEAVGVSVFRATRREYGAAFVIEVPPGPDPLLIVAEAEARVRATADERTIIGGEIPTDLLSGAAYGPNVIKVRDLAPVVITSHAYTVPVCTSIAITHEVRV